MQRFLLFVVTLVFPCSPFTLAQELDVEVKVIGNQAIKEIFKDRRGLIYALPEAEPEVLLRYDGHTITRLGPAVELAEGLDLPEGYEHSWILPTEDDRLVSVSNTTRQVAFIELESLAFRLYDFAELGLAGEFLSLSLGGAPDRYLSTVSIGDSLRVYEWNEEGSSRSFDFAVRFSIEDAKQVVIGDTVLVDVYPGGAFMYDWNGTLLKRLTMADFPDQAVPERISRPVYLAELRYQPDGELYAATRWISPTLWVFNRAKGSFEAVEHPFSGEDAEYVSIPLQDSLGNRLFAGGSWYFPRPFKMQTATGELYDLGYSPKDAVLGNRTHNHFRAFLSDDVTRTVWAASETSGLLRIDFPRERVRHGIKIFGFGNPITYGSDSILVYSVRNGLYRMGMAARSKEENYRHVWYDGRKGVIRTGKHLAFDREGMLWANDDDRLFRVDILGRKGYEIKLPGQIGESWTMYDERTALLAMEAGGMLLVDLVTDSITQVKKEALPEYDEARTLFVRDGEVYAGTDRGFFHGRIGEAVPWGEIQHQGQSIHLHDIYPETPDRWWLATDEGWMRFRPSDNRIERVYTEQDGLPANRVRSSVFARDHYWIGTRKGLSRFSPTTETFRNFSFEEGFSSRRFTEGAAYAPGSNMLGFGTDNGFNYFQPDDLLDEAPPRIRLSSLTHYDGDARRMTRKVAVFGGQQRLSLPAANRSLEAEFFLEHLATAEHHRFAYRVNGDSAPWIDLKGRNRLSFNALDAGQHTIEIRGRTRYSQWSEPLVLQVSVAAFFYETWWFRIGMFLLAVGLVGAWIYRLRRERARLKEKVEERTATIRRDKETIERQAEDLKALDAAKTRFFANISHEFRTPLTVIRGFATESRKAGQTEDASKLRNWMSIIEANSNRLLLLVNQLLELGKLEAGKLEANYQRTDLRPELDLIVASFEAVCYEKDLRLVSSISFDKLAMDTDIDKLLKVLYNLFSNAVKFTPRGGTITLFARLEEPDQVEISLRDTGIGIPEDKREMIFQRFSQVDDASNRKAEGSGIGLNFARELAELMGGSLTVESTVGEGSTFRLILPRWQSVVGTEPASADALLPYLPRHPAAAPASSSPTEKTSGDEDQPLILLVEDNADIIAYLELCLSDEYRLLHARNGEQGMAKALENIPDLIIADVMMPVMDGLDMCRKLKTEERTSHIPVIMLTALGSVENRVKGLREGADAYLSKPFAREELEVQVLNLLEGRKRLRSLFGSNIFGQKAEAPPLSAVSETDAAYTEKERKFLGRVIEIVENQLSDPGLRTDDLAQQLMISKTQLWRKIKAVTGHSPGEMIESIRLEKAASLLADGELNIAEIAYAVGYSDPSYFTKRFSKYFGVVPSDYAGARKSS